MKKALKALAVLALFAVLAVGCSKQAADDGTIKIGISKIVTHPALDASEQGIQDYLNEAGLKVKFDLQNANGEASTAASIAQSFKSSKQDFVVGIGTPVAQALANVFDKTPVLYCAITDPSGAGLTASNLAGASDLTPVAEQVAIWAKATGAKAIGTIYTSSEANSVFLNAEFEKACKANGVEPVSTAVVNTSEIKQAAQALAKRVDAVYIFTDNGVISAIASVADVCTSAGLPLMLADASNAREIDCTLAMGFDYYKLGVAVGKAIESIAKGEKTASDIGTVYLTDASDFEIVVNLDNAKKLNVTIPADVIANASTVIENGQAK